MRAGRWLLRVPASESAGRIFCFPYSGVGASMFNAWPRWIHGLEVCPIQLPGRENRIREDHYRTYEELADRLVVELADFLDRPFAFFGHCAAAIPAYETALRLAGRGLPRPRRLVVSAQVSPQDGPHDRLLELGDDALSDELRTRTISRGGDPQPALIDLSLQVLRADLDANRLYLRTRPDRVDMDISVLYWTQDSEVTRDELSGWSAYADNVDFPELEGGHYDFLDCPPPLQQLFPRWLSTKEAS